MLQLFITFTSLFRKKTVMTDFTVTGIRYQMGDNLSFEQRNDAAARFVAALQIGQPVQLAFEPDNPASPDKAIAVYIDYERIGYIADEECCQVMPLLKDGRWGHGTVVRKDGHVTFFIAIPGTPDNRRVDMPQTRVLPDSPLGSSFRLPFTRAENALQLIATTLTDTPSDDFDALLPLARRYVPLARISICQEDRLWRSLILKKLEHALSDRLKTGGDSDATAEMKTLCSELRTIVGDMHRTAEHWPERIFCEHLDTLRNDDGACDYLYRKFAGTYLDCPTIEEAPRERLTAERNRLCQWLRDMKWSEMRNSRQLMDMGFRVNYLGLSRWELYDLYSVLLLIERMDEVINDPCHADAPNAHDGTLTAALRLENHVLKKNHNGKPIDLKALHATIGKTFVSTIRYGYEWLALWRILNDLHLLEDVRLTAFEELMNQWYPQAQKPCRADSMGDYYSPYLGYTLFIIWSETAFNQQKTPKQSLSGFRRLYNDCDTIKQALKAYC